MKIPAELGSLPYWHLAYFLLLALWVFAVPYVRQGRFLHTTVHWRDVERFYLMHLSHRRHMALFGWLYAVGLWFFGAGPTLILLVRTLEYVSPTFYGRHFQVLLFGWPIAFLLFVAMTLLYQERRDRHYLHRMVQTLANRTVSITWPLPKE